MTIKGAIKAMENGHKVRHRYFSHDEYITMNNGIVVDELGYEHPTFWKIHHSPIWHFDWKIINENK